MIDSNLALKIPLYTKNFSDALEYAAWTTNQSPTQTDKGYKIPYQVYHGEVPSMHHAYIFGGKGVYLVPSAYRNTLDNHVRDCIKLFSLLLTARAVRDLMKFEVWIWMSF